MNSAFSALNRIAALYGETMKEPLVGKHRAQAQELARQCEHQGSGGYHTRREKKHIGINTAMEGDLPRFIGTCEKRRCRASWL